MISKLEQQIYNNHLVISRRSLDKPFRVRKQFEDLKEDKVMLLQKLSKFFLSYPHISQDDFFSAPYKLWNNDTNYDLEFFTTPKAKKAYSQYIKAKEFEDPDTEESLRRLIDGLKFVYDFCKTKSLTFLEYQLYIEETLPCFVTHLKDHKINFYVLHALEFSKINIETRVLDFIFGDFYQTFQKTKNKFYTSKKMKTLAKQAKEKLTIKLK